MEDASPRPGRRYSVAASDPHHTPQAERERRAPRGSARTIPGTVASARSAEGSGDPSSTLGQPAKPQSISQCERSATQGPKLARLQRPCEAEQWRPSRGSAPNRNAEMAPITLPSSSHRSSCHSRATSAANERGQFARSPARRCSQLTASTLHVPLLSRPSVSGPGWGAEGNDGSITTIVEQRLDELVLAERRLDDHVVRVELAKPTNGVTVQRQAGGAHALGAQPHDLRGIESGGAPPTAAPPRPGGRRQGRKQLARIRAPPRDHAHSIRAVERVADRLLLGLGNEPKQNAAALT